VFARKCAECHSSKQPFYTVDTPRSCEQFFDSVKSPEFLAGNTLSDDRRYSVTRLGTNMAQRATNAVDGDVWAELSSKDYKALPPLGRFRMRYTFNGNRLEAKREGAPADPKNDLAIDFTPPGGGRGYYRTPSLVSMWATAPYLHNNALGDLCVIGKDGKQRMFPNDGRDVADEDGTS
jgi:hypothetical protein